MPTWFLHKGSSRQWRTNTLVLTLVALLLFWESYGGTCQSLLKLPTTRQQKMTGPVIAGSLLQAGNKWTLTLWQNSLKRYILQNSNNFPDLISIMHCGYAGRHCSQWVLDCTFPQGTENSCFSQDVAISHSSEIYEESSFPSYVPKVNPLTSTTTATMVVIARLLWTMGGWAHLSPTHPLEGHVLPQLCKYRLLFALPQTISSRHTWECVCVCVGRLNYQVQGSKQDNNPA